MKKRDGEMNSDIRDAFFDRVYELAAQDKNLMFITADADAFSLRRFKKDFPERFINTGVAEQNMVLVAAGLALSGKRVFIYAIIPFIALRCYEHLKVNICGMRLPVTIAGCGAGLSFSNDGPTHHAVNDISVMRTLPELTVLNPCDGYSASRAADIAYRGAGPAYVRIDKGVLPRVYSAGDTCEQGLKVIRKLQRVNILATGFLTHTAVNAAGRLMTAGYNVGVIDLFRLKPVNHTRILGILDRTDVLITLEENCLTSGIGAMISEIMTDNSSKARLVRIALPDFQCFSCGSREWLHRQYGLDAGSVTEKILSRIKCLN